MAQIFIGVGSNRQREQHIRGGIQALRAVFTNLCISTVYENRAVGFDSANFYNFVVGCETRLDAPAVVRQLQQIENDCGRDRNGASPASVTLDLDLLLYDDLITTQAGFRLPRADIDRHAFVLCPLAELAPDLRHPVSGKTFAALWAEFDATAHTLWPVICDLHGE